jgi:hypothetical protein
MVPNWGLTRFGIIKRKQLSGTANSRLEPSEYA